MSGALPVVDPQARIEAVLRHITPERPAVLVKTGKAAYDILTKYDVLTAVASATGDEK